MSRKVFAEAEIDQLKRKAKKMKREGGVTHVGALNLLAVQEGYKDFWELQHHTTLSAEKP